MFRYVGSPIARASQIVSPAALTVTPAAGSGVNVVLSGTGLLDVVGGIRASAEVVVGGSGGPSLQRSANNLYIYSGGASGNIILYSGSGTNVGVFETSPGSKLSVLGNLSVGDSTFSTVAAPVGGAIIQGNVIIGTTAAGASAAKVLALTNGATEPTTSVDLVHIYGLDLSAGNAALAVRQEAAVRTGLLVATHSIPVRWNGATYYLLASNV